LQGAAPPTAPWFRLSGAALLALALGLRVPGLTASLWIDEAGSIARASAVDFWAAAHADVHPPLYFLLLRMGLRLTSSFAVLRAFSVACGLALVAAGILFLRRTPVAAVVLGAILAGLPELMRQSQELRPYALLFLLFGLALMTAIRIAIFGATRAAEAALCITAVAAAATHIGTAPFLVALAPVLAWPAYRRGIRATARSLLPLVPAGLLLLWLEFAFLQRPAGLPEGWWMPRAGMGQMAASLAEATGWSEVGRAADSAARHFAGAGLLIRIAGLGAAIFAAWAAWARRKGEPLALVLLGSGLLYAVVLVAYSRLSEPVVIGRTLFPGMLPIAAGMALGIGANPRRWARAGAILSVFVYLALSCEPVLGRELSPPAGLRGLADEARSLYRRGDQLVLFRSMDYGLRPYWADVANEHPIVIDQTQPIEPQVAELRRRLDSLGRSGRVLIVCREDYYFSSHKAEVEAVFEELSGHGLKPREVWREADLLVYQAARQGR
jgi:hypothetical protein